MIHLLDLTLPDLAANLALDEALLEEAESREEPTQLLRLWESPAFMVVVGRASKVHQEVDVEACRTDNVPIFRRFSGGTAVVTGPGCLAYAVLLSYQRHPDLRLLDHAHAFVMSRMKSALSSLGPPVRHRGTCDLTYGDRKFSGNSLRCKRRHLLYHGTVLYDFPLERIAAWLKTPPRQPDYRANRDHAAFVVNFPRSAAELRAAIISSWDARTPCVDWPEAATEELLRRQYSQDAWNFRL